MSLIRLHSALVAALCLIPTATIAAGAPASVPPAAAVPAPAATAAPAPAATAGTMITPAQADAIILRSGFTPLGQPKQKGNIIGSLARIGNNAFIVTVDATTGQLLDAKPTNIPLPPLASTPAPAASAMPAATAPATATSTHMSPPAANNNVSPVKRAADLARSKGFRVLSFRHVNDDTFLVAQRGNGLFSLKIDDKGRILAIVPTGHGGSNGARPPASLGSLATGDHDNDRR